MCNESLQNAECTFITTGWIGWIRYIIFAFLHKNQISTYNTNCVIDNWWCKTYARQKIKILYQKATENKENLTFMKGNVLVVLCDLPSSLLQHGLVCASKCRLQRVLHASYLGPAETGGPTPRRAAEVTIFRTRTTRGHYIMIALLVDCPGQTSSRKLNILKIL